MTQNQTIHIRDKRQPGYYQIDTVFVKGGWAKALGPYGIAVYNALACFADNDTQDAYPMYQTIADLIGCSRRQVLRAIAELVKHRLVKKNERYNDKGQTSNLFELLHRDQWIKPSNLEKVEGDSQSSPVSDSQSPKLSPDSLTIPNLKEGAATAPPAPPPQKPKSNQAKARSPKHPAIETYRTVIGRYPPKAVESLIIDAGIQTETDLQFWADVIRHCLACGWNPCNIECMLDHYHRRALPTTRPNQSSRKGGYNASNRQTSAKSTYCPATPADFELD